MKRSSLIFIVLSLVLVVSFTVHQMVRATTGGGTATIGIDGGAQGAGVTVDVSTSHIFTTILTIPIGGMTLGASSPTFAIPTGFTAPNATPVANVGLVDADGEWSVVGGGGGCTVDSSPVSVTTTATGQVMTVDVTADCAVGNTITLTYQGTSGIAMAATALTISTADAGDVSPVTPLIAGSPTITVTAAAAPTVAVTMDDNALNIGDTSLVTFTFSAAPVGFTTADVTVANGSIGVIDASNPLVQTAVYTPTNGITDATNVISVGTDWTNAGLTPGVGGDSPNYTIDTVAPTVAVTMSDNALAVGEVSLVTFTFSEVPVGFTVADVTSFPNGTLSGFTVTGDPLVYTVIFTPDVSVNDATNLISVGTAWTDAALNVGVGDDSPNYTINTVVSSGGGGGGGGGFLSIVPPLIDVVKVPSPLALPNGPGLVTYTYTLRNIGTVSVSNITMVDDTCSPIGLVSGDTNNDNILNVNEVWTYNCFTTLLSTHTNTVTATGRANGISAVDIASATVIVGVSVVPPLIHVTKVPSVFALPSPGGAVTYTYTVTNPGTVPLNDVSIVDDKCTGLPGRVLGHPGDLNKNNLLESNEAWSFTCLTNLTKTTTNTGLAEGHANGLTARDFAIATVVVGTPSLPQTGFPPEETNNLANIILESVFILGTLYAIKNIIKMVVIRS